LLWVDKGGKGGGAEKEKPALLKRGGHMVQPTPRGKKGCGRAESV